MIISTSQDVSGKKVTKTIGVVTGSTIRAKHLGKDIRAAGRTLIGGEMTYYSELLTESRDTATKRMVDEAETLGADAIINIRYQTAMVMAGASEVLAYGTAVKIE